MLKPRLKKFYENIICEDFILLYNFENVSCLPNLEKITLNSTSGRFASEPLASMHCFSAWFLGVSQKCVSTRARKSIALFHLRKDNLLGLKVNCRKKANFALLDKLLIWILPRLLSNSLKINKNKQSQSANSLQERAKINQKAGKISRAPFTHRNQNQDKEQNQTKSKLDFGFHKKNRVGRIYLLEMQKKNNKKKTTKFFFTFGHNSARFVPEIAALAVFSDSAFGFSFTCSMAHKLKQHYLSSYRDLPKNLPIQDYFLSMVLHDFAFQNHAKPKREQVDNGETRVENWNQNLFPLRQSQDCARNGIKTQFISAFQFPVSELLFRL